MEIVNQGKSLIIDKIASNKATVTTVKNQSLRITSILYFINKKSKTIATRNAGNIPAKKIFKTSPEGIEVHSKFMEKECIELSKLSKDEHMTKFFKNKK